MNTSYDSELWKLSDSCQLQAGQQIIAVADGIQLAAGKIK
jgi:hypothetical protein